MLGFRKYDDGFKNDWMSFYPGWRKLNFRFGPASYFDNRFSINFSLGWGQFYIHIPFIRSKYDEAEPPEYGFYFYSDSHWFPDSLCIKYGRKCKFIYLPWALEWYRTSYYMEDGEWLHEYKGKRIEDKYSEEFENRKFRQKAPYTYVLESGKVQNRIATIKVDEREWRRRWLMWAPIFNRVRTTIDVEFDGEVGERSGSWKGGTIGCGYDLLPKETPLQCLRRMERERKFT